jgi:lactoylglutathione lyase
VSSASFSEQVEVHGIILHSWDFDGCVAFYRDTLELPVWHEKDGLCCFHFGAGYLMIERSGRDKPIQHNSTKLRFNVADVDAAAEVLISRGVSVVIEQFNWGRVATFRDPDGNLCGLRNADHPDFDR